jgi:hypothetical protein
VAAWQRLRAIAMPSRDFRSYRRNAATSARRFARNQPAVVHAALTNWNQFVMSQVQNPSKLRDIIMRRAVALVGLFGIIGAGMSLALLPATNTVAAPKAERTYLIPAGDGYGVADCIASKSECGQIVADAWCESQGHRTAKAYGLASQEDFTGSTPRPAAVSEAERPLVITCGG